MNKVDINLVTRVMRNITKHLDETIDIMPSILGKLIHNYHLSLKENNVASYLVSIQMLQKHIKESYNQETLDVIMTRLTEHDIIPKEITKYDLTSPYGFLKAMEDEIIREMVSGASIGGSLSGLGSNQQINATGLAGKDPILGKKKRNKVINVMNRRL